MCTDELEMPWFLVVIETFKNTTETFKINNQTN